MCRFHRIAKGSSRGIALPTYLLGHDYHFWSFFLLFSQERLGVHTFFFALRTRVCIVFTMGWFRAIGWISFILCFVLSPFSFFHSYPLIFLSFICVRFLFLFFFEGFFLANFSKMIPASICQVRVTLELQAWVYFWSIYLLLIIYSNASFLLFSGSWERWRID